jgi:branched-chain amino acid transport system permease protein
MGVTESSERGRGGIVERPGLVILVLLGVAFGQLLIVDLALKLVGVKIWMFGGSLTISDLSRLFWGGIARGLVFGLAGVGLSMTYSILTFANFSHGDLVTTGAFTGWGVTYLIIGSGTLTAGELLLVRPGGIGTPGAIGANVVATPVAILGGMVFAGLATATVALAIDRAVYRPLRDRRGIILLISSVGVAFSLRYLIQFVYGSRTRGVRASFDAGEPAAELFGYTLVTGEGDLNIFGVSQFDLNAVTLMVVSLLLMGALHLLLQRTKLGTAMRAMADNEDLALITGIPTERIVTATWLIGGGITGVSGFLIILFRNSIRFNFGWLLLLLIFSAVILGGIGSIYGAIAGGVIIGLVLSLSTIWIPSDFSPRVFAFLAMIIVLLFRPQGLFGGVETA